jgi:hypothetical protein
MKLRNELSEEAKKLCEEEYKKALVKKAVDLQFDTSYMTLVTLTLALAALVFVNRTTQDEIARFGLWSIIVVIGIFVIYEFCQFFSRKAELVKLIKEETKCSK